MMMHTTCSMLGRETCLRHVMNLSKTAKFLKGRCSDGRLCTTTLRLSSESQASHKSPETPLLKQLQARIKFSGPLTIYEYMKEALINPVCGYYSTGKDMFGVQGDYITSPEISQMFGELVGVWVLSEWYKLGSPQPLQIVELGPGRGTLMHDVLKVLHKFELSGENLSVHLIEVSEELSSAQERMLCGGGGGGGGGVVDKDKDLHYRTSTTTTTGSPVYWYRHLSFVPKGFTVYLAHEFFDALPIHKLHRTDEGWREVLVDIDEGDGPHHLRYVLSKAPTPAAKLFAQGEECREVVEVSPEGGVLCRELAARIEEDGGFALIMDYGHDGRDLDTFKAFKRHRQQHPLSEPGTADLTADVDFNYLKEQVKDKLVTFGPVTQSAFLINMGIETRLHNLLSNCRSREERESLISGFRMLTEPQQMGEAFKCVAFYPGVVRDFLIKHPPAGFFRDVD